MNIWFTSDTHYHHKNIVRGTSEWGTNLGQEVRNFNTLEEHDATLVENINKYVKENDILYHLGDWSFGGIEQVGVFRNKINCKNIHLILGNHDHHIENNRILPNIVNYIDAGPSEMRKLIQVQAQSLFTSVQHVLLKKIGGKTFFLSHYAHRTWPKAHHGIIHLYGHSHGSLPNYEQKPNKHLIDEIGKFPFTEYEPKLFKCMDIGIDTHPEFRPYHINEIFEIMDKRIPLTVDHHNEKTN